MKSLVEMTPAWNQLLEQNVFQFDSFPRIEIDDVAVEFHQVPHRDELSDTHAIVVRGENKSILFCLIATLGKRHLMHTVA